MRSPAPSAERMDSITVSTAVAALARGITSRSTTRSTMSALIMCPPGRWQSLYLFLLQPDSVCESGAGGVGEVPEVGQVVRRDCPRPRRGHEEERDRLFPDENG